MAKHRRWAPLARLLASRGWQRDPTQWTVRCRDGCGRRARIRVHLVSGRIVLSTDSTGPWLVAPLDAGRLRAALRDAARHFGFIPESPVDDDLPAARRDAGDQLGELVGEPGVIGGEERAARRAVWVGGTGPREVAPEIGVDPGELGGHDFPPGPVPTADHQVAGTETRPGQHVGGGA